MQGLQAELFHFFFTALCFLRYSSLKLKHASDLLDPEDSARGGFRRFAPALSMLRAEARGDQEFPEQTVKIVRKRVARNFGGGGHLGVYPRLIP